MQRKTIIIGIVVALLLTAGLIGFVVLRASSQLHKINQVTDTAALRTPTTCDFFTTQQMDYKADQFYAGIPPNLQPLPAGAKLCGNSPQLHNTYIINSPSDTDLIKFYTAQWTAHGCQVDTTSQITNFVEVMRKSSNALFPNASAFRCNNGQDFALILPYRERAAYMIRYYPKAIKTNK